MTSATIYLTGECNLRCKHCLVGHDQLRPRDALSTSDVLSILSNLDRSGIKSVTLLGGEVTAYRQDLPVIVNHCDKLGMQVSVNTNLIDISRLTEILDVPALTNIVVSLDGLSQQTHDRLRGHGSFGKAITNLGLISQHARVAGQGILLDITFVLTDMNKGEIFELIALYRRFPINKINLKTLQYSDRAARNQHSIGVGRKELLDLCTSFYVYCRLEGNINIDMHVPPAFGVYLDRVFGLDEQFWNFASCGGTDVYSYVDLYGNNLPCPAMSYEENRLSKVTHRSESLNIVSNSVENIRNHALFVEFNRTVEMKTRNSRMHPCRECKFSDRCSPCTSEVIKGETLGTVDLCSAVYEFGNERVEGIKEEIFSIHQ